MPVFEEVSSLILNNSGLFDPDELDSTVEYIQNMPVGKVTRIAFASDPERQRLVTLVHVAAEKAEAKVAIKRKFYEDGYVVFKRVS